MDPVKFTFRNIGIILFSFLCRREVILQHVKTRMPLHSHLNNNDILRLIVRVMQMLIIHHRDHSAHREYLIKYCYIVFVTLFACPPPCSPGHFRVIFVRQTFASDIIHRNNNTVPPRNKLHPSILHSRLVDYVFQ